MGRLTRGLFLLLLHLLITSSTSATQLAELVQNPVFFTTYTFRTFRDGTFLASGLSLEASFKELKLNSIVSVPSPPPDDKLEGTILLTRVYPNSTVIWATAITTMRINVGIDLDNRDNVYAAASPIYSLKRPLGTVHIIKHDPDGKRLYEIFHKPLQESPKFATYIPMYRIDQNDFPREAGLAFVPPNTLIIGAQLHLIKFGSEGRPALLTFNAKNGAFLSVQGAKPPKNIKPGGSFSTTTNVPVSRTKRGPLACYMFEASNNIFNGVDRLFARCTLLTKTGTPVTREIDAGQTHLDSFFYEVVALEEGSVPSRLPSFFVAYNKWIGNQDKHQLVLRRLNAETLEDVDWATGRKSKSARPIVVNLPDAAYLSTFKHSPKTNSVTLFLETLTRISEFIPDASGRGEITAVVDPTQRYGGQYWLFTFDEKRQLTPQHLDLAEDFSPFVFDFSRNNKCVHLYGAMEVENTPASRGGVYKAHPMFQSISNAHTCRKATGCC